MSQMILENLGYLDQLGRQLAALKRWQPMIEKIMRRAKSLHTFDAVVQSIVRGERFLLHTDRAFIIVQPDQRPLGLNLYVYAAGGDDKQALLALARQLEDVARSVGAKQLTALGRKGFEAWPEAWKSTGQTYFVKEL